MEKDRGLKIQLTEIFMAKAGKKGWDRCFHGTITRGIDDNSNPVVCGRIKIHDGYLYAKASDQWELGEILDEMVLIVLDAGIHAHTGKFLRIRNFEYHLN